MNTLKAVLSNTSSQIIGRIISSGTGFFITLLIARFYGIVFYSDLAKITALVGLLYLGIDLGANAIFLQLEEKRQQFHNLVWFRLELALILFLGINVAVFLLPYNGALTSGYSPVVKLGIILFSLSFFTRAIVYSCGAFFQKQMVYSYATWATIVSSLTTLFFACVFAVLHLPLLWIVSIYVVGGIGEALVSLYFLKGVAHFSLPSFSFSKQLFLSALPLTILLFLNLLYFRMDMILLTLFKRATDVGIYDYAYKFFDFLIALPLFLSNSIYPILLGLEKNSRIQRKNVTLYTCIFFLMGAILVPIVWILAPFIALVKNDFIQSVLPLRILALSLPVFFATNILQWIFITKKKQTFLVFVYGGSLFLNVLLNLLFIPQYSYLASALITGFSELLILIIMTVYLFIAKL